MAQSVNVKFAKCFIVFMAVVILVEGVGYLGLAIWGITLHDCAGENSDPVNRPFEFVLDLVYFSSAKCGPPMLHVEGGAVDVTVPMEIDFAVAEVVSNREFIFLITYTVISALWIVTSLFVLVTLCGPITKLVAAICFWPWFFVIMAGSVLDAVATGYHIHDIFHTTSANSTFEYVGVAQIDIVTEYLQDYDIYFITPAVAFTCISSRVVLIWLLNIFGAIFCLSLAKVLAANNTKNNNEPQHRLPVDTAVPTQPQRQQMQEIQQQDTVVLRYHPTAPPPDSTRKDRRTLEPLKLAQDPSPQSEIMPYPPPVARQQSTKNKRISELKTQSSVNTDTPTYQSSDAHPANLDYPSRNGTMTSAAIPRSATPELSPISPLNMRYSTPDGPAFPSQPHVTQELRGQLPWSYTNIMNDPIAQKRIQSHLQPDDEDFPSIPAPDYTMHHPKKDRSQVNPDRLSQTGYSRW